jgi:hypothetical protein
MLRVQIEGQQHEQQDEDLEEGQLVRTMSANIKYYEQNMCV